MRMIMISALLWASHALATEVEPMEPYVVPVLSSTWDKLDRGNAKVGDYVEYWSSNSPQNKIRQEVVAVSLEKREITIRETETRASGAQVRSRKIVAMYVLPEPDPEEAKKNKDDIRTTSEKLVIGDKTIEATRESLYVNGKLMSSEWYSKDIPAMGLARYQFFSDTRLGKQTIVIVTSFGHKQKGEGNGP